MITKTVWMSLVFARKSPTQRRRHPSLARAETDMKKSKSDSKTIVKAIEVFVRGFAFTKSRTYPYEVLQINGVWAMRDAERKNAQDYRKEEWIGFGVEPSLLHETARKNTRGRYFLGALETDPDAISKTRDIYRSLGYRLLSTEPLFIHDLSRIPSGRSSANIVRMNTGPLAEAYAKEAKLRPIPAEHLASNSPWRHYLAFADDRIVGWVSSIKVDDSNWCSNLVVRSAFRRKGIGSALLCKMLRDDRTRGSSRSILLSSHVGALVYPEVGYRQLGTLLILVPKKKREKGTDRVRGTRLRSTQRSF